jgi:hypothetical protein
MKTMNRRAAAIVGAGVLMIAVGAVGAGSTVASAGNKPAQNSAPPAASAVMTAPAQQTPVPASVNQTASKAGGAKTSAQSKKTSVKASAGQKKAAVKTTQTKAQLKRANSQAKVSAKKGAIPAKTANRVRG